jgi:adenylate cyclase
MSNVLHRHDALINKFMGDGIFAFFNPPILPCAAHERAACEAALDSLAALRELAARYADHPLAEEFRRLHMRVGITSGPVFVGDYGSENKLDYTCVGDTVNLASRLEGANKFFGSSIMVAGPTRDAVRDLFTFRSLGRLQVKGQTVAVRVYELLGRAGEVNGDAAAFTSSFETAVEAFASRDWEGSATGFRRCLEMRPDERGAMRYLEVIEAYRASPPPSDWNMGIELTEK